MAWKLLRCGSRSLSFMLITIAVVAIGGTSLFGGRGGVAGTLAGVFLLAMLANVLNLEGVQTRHADPDAVLRGIAAASDGDVQGVLAEAYAPPAACPARRRARHAATCASSA